MNILSITAQKPHSTGSGTYLTELVRSWDRAGHRQAVVCGIYPDDMVDFPDGVICYAVFFTDTSACEPASADTLFCSCKTKGSLVPALPFPVTGMSDIMPYTSTMYSALTPSMISQMESAFMSAVKRAVEDLDPDLIICHHLFLLTAMVRKHFPGRKVCGLSHGSDLRQAVSCPHLKDLIEDDISSLDRIFALHSEQARRISGLYGVPESRITVVGTGYNSMRFNTAGRQPRSLISDHDLPVRLSYAGKMSAAKGIPEFFAALSQLSSDPSVPQFEVTMAGGCQEIPVRALLDAAPAYIHWVGQIPQDQLAEIFRSSDIFVLPSFYEGLPLVLIEAMASGAVPVCTDLPGVQKWVSSKVPDHNARFIPMPEMASVDEPTQAGREAFISDLIRILRDLITEIHSGELPGNLPDTGSITWDAVAESIIA